MLTRWFESTLFLWVLSLVTRVFGPYRSKDLPQPETSTKVKTIPERPRIVRQNKTKTSPEKKMFAGQKANQNKDSLFVWEESICYVLFIPLSERNNRNMEEA